MIHTIHAMESGMPALTIRVRSDMGREDLELEIREAVKDFVETPGAARDNALEATGGKFAWGDLAMWLPADIARDHGFEILDTATEEFTVDYNGSLLPKGFQWDEDALYANK